MHEHSLVRALIAQVRQVVAENGGGAIRQVRVQIGPLSGAEPMLLQSAWMKLSAESDVPQAALVIDEVLLLAECADCLRQFEPEGFCFRCPHCGGTHTGALSGDGVILHSIVTDDVGQGAVT